MLINSFWTWIDGLLERFGLPVTMGSEFLMATFTIGGSLLVAWLLFEIFIRPFLPKPRRVGRSNIRLASIVSVPQEVRKEKSRKPWEQVLRAKWKLFPEEKVSHRGTLGLKPFLIGYLVEVGEGELALYIGDDEGGWFKFSRPDPVSQTLKELLLDGLEQKTGICRWRTQDWRVEEDHGPFRAEVVGNTYLRGNELVRILVMRTKDREQKDFSLELFLLTLVRYTGGRGWRGGSNATLWQKGHKVHKREVAAWEKQEVVVSHESMDQYFKD